MYITSTDLYIACILVKEEEEIILTMQDNEEKTNCYHDLLRGANKLEMLWVSDLI
jgi:hypothetical protein